MAAHQPQLSKDLIDWGNVLRATHGMADVTKEIEETKETLQAVAEYSRRIELNNINFQQAREKLSECVVKAGTLCQMGTPLKEQHEKIESCLRRVIASASISSTEIGEIKTELEKSVQICKEYELLLMSFLESMKRVRELYQFVIDYAENETEAARADASNTRWKGYGGTAALTSIAAMLGISGAVLALPAAAVVAAAAVEVGYDTTLSANNLDLKVQKFHETVAQLQSCELAFGALMDRVQLGPVALNEELIECLAHVLQMYSKYHDKETEVELLRQKNIQLAMDNKNWMMKEQEQEEEIERLNRKIARLTSNESNP